MCKMCMCNGCVVCVSSYYLLLPYLLLYSATVNGVTHDLIYNHFILIVLGIIFFN